MGFFYNRFEKSALDKAYEFLENITPLDYDCGLLCGGKCCRGDADDGMLLFPGEKEFFENEPGFEVRFDEKYASYAVYCSGRCSRDKRPLSCRIFPYMFYCSETGGKESIRVAPDIRAGEYCDILSGGLSVRRDFIRKMRLAAKALERDEDCVRFISQLTELLTDFGQL